MSREKGVCRPREIDPEHNWIMRKFRAYEPSSRVSLTFSSAASHQFKQIGRCLVFHVGHSLRGSAGIHRFLPRPTKETMFQSSRNLKGNPWMRLPVSFLWIADYNGIIAGLHRGPRFLFPPKFNSPKLNSFSNPLTLKLSRDCNCQVPPGGLDVKPGKIPCSWPGKEMFNFLFTS